MRQVCCVRTHPRTCTYLHTLIYTHRHCIDSIIWCCTNILRSPQPPPPPSAPPSMTLSFHKSVSPTYITHTHTFTLMQACSISSNRSFFSCLNTLYHSVPASHCSVSALPLTPSLPSSSLLLFLTLSPTITPNIFFQA